MTTLLADLRAAAAVWRRRPELLVVESVITVLAVALALLVPDLDPEVERATSNEYWIIGLGLLVTVVITVPQLAWIGAQRVVYAEAWADPASAGLSGTGLLITARRQTRRFLVLGLFAGIALFPVLAVSTTEPLTTTGGVLSMVLLLTADVLLTFVTPALALSTTSVRVALAVGWRLLRGHWDEVEWHAMLPPVVLGLHTFADLPDRFESATTLLLVPLLVAVRGAVVRLYLRLPHEQVLQEVEDGIAGRER